MQYLSRTCRSVRSDRGTSSHGWARVPPLSSQGFRPLAKPESPSHLWHSGSLDRVSWYLCSSALPGLGAPSDGPLWLCSALLAESLSLWPVAALKSRSIFLARRLLRWRELHGLYAHRKGCNRCTRPACPGCRKPLISSLDAVHRRRRCE